MNPNRHVIPGVLHPRPATDPLPLPAPPLLCPGCQLQRFLKKPQCRAVILILFLGAKMFRYGIIGQSFIKFLILTKNIQQNSKKFQSNYSPTKVKSANKNVMSSIL